MSAFSAALLMAVLVATLDSVRRRSCISWNAAFLPRAPTSKIVSVGRNELTDASSLARASAMSSCALDAAGSAPL
jgi:hypothetical protein